MLARILVFVLALALFFPGLAGLSLSRVGSERAGEIRSAAESWLRTTARKQGLSLDRKDALVGRASRAADALERRQTHVPLLGFGLLLLFFAARRPKKSTLGLGEPVTDNVGLPSGASYSKREIRRIVKDARVLQAEKGAEAAGEFLFGQGLLDEAAEMFTRGGLLNRAAQVRHDQNRFHEAAELLLQAGKLEAAAATYAQIECFEEAARCYRDAEKFSVAGEMFERAENFREAGRCYQGIGFHRHAAQAFLKAGCEEDAAESFVAAFNDEGGGGNLPEHRVKEMCALAREAGELLTKLERFEDAELILERAGEYARAGRVAFQREAFDRASELFLRVGRGDLAAKALERLDDAEGAARVLGEYLRDQGEDEEAAVQLERAGNHADAADLYRKLERYQEAGDCYWRAGDYEPAAEMFTAGQTHERAAEAYEQAGRYQDAAESYAAAGNPARQAELLERADCFYEAGRSYAEQDRTDDAIRVLQRVEAGSPHFEEACGQLGQLFQAKGMHGLSIKKFQEATGSGPVTRANVEAHFKIGKLFEERQQFDAASETYEKILSFDYQYADVSGRLERVKQGKSTRSEGGAGKAAQTTQPEPLRYQVIRELGRGGMGVVHLAHDQVLDRDVAYKVLPESLRGSTNALRSFLREAKAAAQLNHPNIVTVYDAGESEHGFYLAMEYVDGTTLKEIVQRRGAIATAGVVYIVRQMVDALSYAHSKRVVHRDIKAANTMWARDKQVKIMDFGLAKVMEEMRNATTLVSGTPFYMSPEQTLGQSVDHRCDIYSLGVTIFELATGQLPFRTGNVPYHHVHTPPPDPRSIRSDLPEPLAKIILRCLEKDPAERFQDAKEILEVLQSTSDGSV